MEKELTNDEVVRRWREQICKPAQATETTMNEIDGEAPDWERYNWEGIWVGFVIGLGRPDLANYRSYMDLGFPWEGVA